MPCIEPRYHIKFPQFQKPSGPKPPINLWLIIEYHWVDLCIKTSLIERNLDAFLWWEISDFHPRMTQTHQDFFIHLFVLKILKWTYWKASPKLGKIAISSAGWFWFYLWPGEVHPLLRWNLRRPVKSWLGDEACIYKQCIQTCRKNACNHIK